MVRYSIGSTASTTWLTIRAIVSVHDHKVAEPGKRVRGGAAGLALNWRYGRARTNGQALRTCDDRGTRHRRGQALLLAARLRGRDIDGDRRADHGSLYGSPGHRDRARHAGAEGRGAAP